MSERGLDVERLGIGQELVDLALTERELQVLALVGNGLDNSAIAQELTIGRRTVETHVRHIYAKLGYSSRAKAMLFAIRVGLVTVDQA